MKNEKIKVVGLDFDNTLYDGPDSLRETKSWLERLSREGLKVGLVTGRTFGSLQSLFERDGYVWGAPFPNFVICFESRILDASGNCISGCETWNSERDEDVRRAHGILELTLPDWMKQLEADGMVCRMTYSDPHYGIFLEFETFEHAVTAHEKLSRQADPAHKLRFVRNYSGLSVHAQNRSKGPALASMLKQWGIAQEETLVIGDSLNDLCMMNGEYNYRVATVANADPVIIAAVRKKNGIVASEKVGKGVVEIFEKVFGDS